MILLNQILCHRIIAYHILYFISFVIGASIEQGSSTPLMEAAQEGHVDLVKFLLEQGTYVLCFVKSRT